MENPFVLGFGEIPTLMLDTGSRTSIILNDLNASRPNLRNFMISGIRGSGKTCLLRTIEEELLQDKKWIVVNLDMGDGISKNLLNQMAAILYSLPGMKMKYLSAKVNIDVLDKVNVSFNESNIFTDIRTEIEKMLETLKKLNKKILITLDEISDTKGVREFASAYNILVGKGYPIYFIAAGLKENIETLKDLPNFSFLRRSYPLKLEGLNITSIRSEYAKIFNLPIEQAQELAELTGRYSFAFQALGYVYFEFGKEKNWINRYDELLAAYVYDSLWNQLSAKDKETLMFIHNTPSDSNGIRKTCDILNVSGLNKNTFNIYRRRLIFSSIISSSDYGEVKYNYPRFDIFLQNKSEIY